VLRVLQQVAEKNTSILRHPPPIAVLDNLGENAMDFSVRVFLADINRSLQAQTELRMAIVKALREEGIDIPYNNALAGHAESARVSAGRAEIKIGVGHDCDPAVVLEVLREAGHQSGLLVDGGDATVVFDDIDDSALNFSVSVPLTDGTSIQAAETALRTQAVKTLRARGIALASPQRQVRLRDLEGLRTFVTKLAEERARSAQARDHHDASMSPRKPDND
jgi:potassium-dependent mechanosensitive channel